MDTKYKTREEYLVASIEVMRPWFEAKGYKIPKVRVTCGWPSSGGTGKKKNVGECWATEASEDGSSQIFISPYLVETGGEHGVIATVVHEVVHAVVGIAAKHGAKFKECALAVGLHGKMTSCGAGPELEEIIKGWEVELGAYPHAKLDPGLRPTKKQSTRMFKCECKNPECGMVVRTSRKWLDAVGIPHCPKHGRMESDYIQDEGGEGEENE